MWTRDLIWRAQEKKIVFDTTHRKHARTRTHTRNIRSRVQEWQPWVIRSVLAALGGRRTAQADSNASCALKRHARPPEPQVGADSPGH